MKVLLLCKNLFALAPNGGSRVYENIVLNNPSIDFFFFTDIDGIIGLPRNINLISTTASIYGGGINQLLDAARGNHFDVVDWPDWLAIEIDPRTLLAKYEITFDKFCVALHGSSSLVLANSPFKVDLKSSLRSLRRLENNLYRNCDFAYGISRMYADRIGVTNKFKLVEPAHFIKKFPNRNGYFHSANFIFLGRREGTKGFGNFLSLLSTSTEEWKGEIYGPDSYSWEEYRYWNLSTYAAHEKVKIDTTLTEDEVTDLLKYRRGFFTFLSEFDSFNLACADALSSGQAAIVYEDLPALRYFQEKGVRIEAVILQKSIDLMDESQVLKIQQECQRIRPLQLEVMRNDINTILRKESIELNYMEKVYGSY